MNKISPPKVPSSFRAFRVKSIGELDAEWIKENFRMIIRNRINMGIRHDGVQYLFIDKRQIEMGKVMSDYDSRSLDIGYELEPMNLEYATPYNTDKGSVVFASGQWPTSHDAFSACEAYYGNRYSGIVVDINKKEMRCNVEWDVTHLVSNRCKIGADNVFSLFLVTKSTRDLNMVKNLVDLAKKLGDGEI